MAHAAWVHTALIQAVPVQAVQVDSPAEDTVEAHAVAVDTSVEEDDSKYINM